jgi:hypothetical protein
VKAPRPSFADLRLVCDYLRALRNEIAVDLQAIEIAGLDPVSYGKIPRPSRWIGKARRFAFLSRLIHGISLPAWYFMGPWLFRRQCQAVRTSWSPAGAVKFDEAGQVLAFSVRTMDIVHPGHISPAPSQWVELPWLPLSNLPTGSEVLSAVGLLSDADMKRSLTLATYAHRALQRRRGMSGWGLQSYTAWRWFLVRLAVDKLPGPLLTVDHFDRWAVLADSSVWRTRVQAPNRQLIVMQHGSVNADGPRLGLGFQLPTRLRAVNRLHVYSDADAQVFLRDILSHGCVKREPVVSYYQPVVRLSEMSELGRSSILFVGHPLCESAHCALMIELQRITDVQVFYKPHPTTGSGNNALEMPWTLIRGRMVFPRVDAIVSYPSTLVAEYAAHSIPAIVHRMDISEQQILDKVPEILRLIRGSNRTDKT